MNASKLDAVGGYNAVFAYVRVESRVTTRAEHLGLSRRRA